MLEVVGAKVAVGTSRPNIGLNIEVAKLQTFDRTVSKVLGFLTVCKLFIRMRMRKMVVKEQIQWGLLYI